jgi:hypothetical protein
MGIPPAWMIEELERLRREQEAQRLQLSIHIPLPTLRDDHDDAEPAQEPLRGVIIIPLR